MLAGRRLSREFVIVAGYYSNGYYSHINDLRLDRYVVDTLMADLVGHDRSPSSFLVYLALWAKAGVRRGAAARMSLADLAEETGLSKSAVQSAIRNLLRRRLLAVTRPTPTSTPFYAVLRPWRRGRSR